MATTTGTVNVYQPWLAVMCEGANCESDTFIQLLTTSTHVPAATDSSEDTDIDNEVSGNGYARKTLTQSSDQSGGTYTFDADNPVQTASGGSIVARYWHIMDDTLAGDTLVAYGLLDETPGDVTTTDTNTMTITWNASGIYTIS